MSSDAAVTQGAFVLPSDVVLAPVEELPETLRARLTCRPGDRILTRPRSRVPSSVVDDETARLLRLFRAPCSIAEAIVAHSRAAGLDPSDTLERAFPILQKFINAGILVPADSPLADALVSSHSEEDVIGGFEIKFPVHAAVDAEVYLARSSEGAFAAFKCARPGFEAALLRHLAKEAAALRHLDGRVAPELLAEGSDPPFLASRWCPGVDASAAALELRRPGDPNSRRDLLTLTSSVLGAYATLHEHGILHGDVHPRNTLVDADGGVTLIDFGLACLASPDPNAAGPRRGLEFNTEPEVARARLEQRPVPALTSRAEQYSVAALAYLLLTGSWTQQYSLEKLQMLRQVARADVLPFPEHGVHGLDSVESVLRQALAPEPSQRFPTTRALSDTFDEAATEDLRSNRIRPARRASGADRLVADVLDRFGMSGRFWASGLEPPTCSLSSGAAGIAYALRRIAMARPDTEALALADAWAQKAVAARASEEAFSAPALKITPDTVGTISVFHSAAGVHLSDALIACTRQDSIAASAACRAFIEASAGHRLGIDVWVGSAGSLLACALLDEAQAAAGDQGALRALGDQLAGEICAVIGCPGLSSQRGDLLGAAHGRAGVLYALLRWHESSGWSLPVFVPRQLDELARLALPEGRGVRWPIRVGAPAADRALSASWCNGASGHVYLWALAERLLEEDAYGRLAERAAWTAYEARNELGDLCCGLAGRAYAVLNIFKRTGDDVWRRRARHLAERAVQSIVRAPARRHSLFNGEIGVAVLAADLSQPEWSAMPLYEAEGWPCTRLAVRPGDPCRPARMADRGEARATPRS